MSARHHRPSFLLACAGLLAAACTVQIAGTDRTAVIRGRVLTGGAPVSPALVVAAGLFQPLPDGGLPPLAPSLDGGAPAASTWAFTAADGTFALRLTNVPDRIVLKVSAADYAPTYSVVEYRAGVFHYALDVALARPVVLNVAADGGVGTVTVGARTFNFKVPAGIVPDGGRLEVTAVAPENGPGAMETSEGLDRRLQTQGMFYVRAVDAAGRTAPLTVGAGQGVTLDYASEVAAVPDSEPTKVYTMGDDAVWAPSTSSSASGKDFLAQQNGWWNADRAYRTACFRGKLKAPNKTCAGERVKAGGLDGIYTQDTTSADGYFCVEGPQGRSQNLQVGSTSTSVVFPQTAGSCRTNPMGCDDRGEFTVADADCPASCDKTKQDSPDGCVTPSTPGGGDPFFGYQCSSAQVCCPSSNQGCGRTWKSCADSTGGGGYITSDGKKFWCAQASDQTCVQARARETINYCGL